MSFLSACFLSVIPVSLFPLCHSCQPVSSLSFLSACFLSVIPVSLFPLCHSCQPASSLSYTIAFTLPFIPQYMPIPLSCGQSLFEAECHRILNDWHSHVSGWWWHLLWGRRPPLLWSIRRTWRWRETNLWHSTARQLAADFHEKGFHIERMYAQYFNQCLVTYEKPYWLCLWLTLLYWFEDFCLSWIFSQSFSIYHWSRHKAIICRDWPVLPVNEPKKLGARSASKTH